MDTKKDTLPSVLLVDENDSGKVKVVSGLDDNGKLKTVEPKEENQSLFLKVSKQDNMLENFLSNYYRQAENPTHTGFYKVMMNDIESIANVVGAMLKSGVEGNDFLKTYKVDTAKHQPEDTQKKLEFKPLDAEKIDWAQFEKIGIKRENLENTKSLSDMLIYRRSSGLFPIKIQIDDLTINTDARLSLRHGNDGLLIPVIHAVRQAPQLDKQFYGNTFTDADKENLLKTGNLGRTIDLHINGLDKKINSFVSIDQKTNELVAYNTKNVYISNTIKGVTLSEEQKQKLLEGKGVFVEGMTAKSGKKFDATLQINAAERGIVFRFDQPKQFQQQSNTEQQKQGEMRIPNKLGGVALSDDKQAALKKGDVIYVEGMLDKKGQLYNAYVQVNEEKGKLDFYKWDPRKKQGVSPDNASKTQVEVNSNGKTNEATKNNTQALQKEQVNPKDETQQKQNKPKGMRM